MWGNIVMTKLSPSLSQKLIVNLSIARIYFYYLLLIVFKAQLSNVASLVIEEFDLHFNIHPFQFFCWQIFFPIFNISCSYTVHPRMNSHGFAYIVPCLCLSISINVKQTEPFANSIFILHIRLTVVLMSDGNEHRTFCWLAGPQRTTQV